MLSAGAEGDGGAVVTRHHIEKAEEGTPQVDALLAAGWDPFAVVSTAIEGQRFDDNYGPTMIVLGYVNMIWFRRVEVSDAR